MFKYTFSTFKLIKFINFLNFDWKSNNNDCLEVSFIFSLFELNERKFEFFLTVKNNEFFHNCQKIRNSILKPSNKLKRTKICKNFYFLSYQTHIICTFLNSTFSKSHSYRLTFSTHIIPIWEKQKRIVSFKYLEERNTPPLMNM